MSLCVSVFLQSKISLTAEPIWYSFTMQLLIGPAKVITFWGRIPPHFQEKSPPKIFYFFLFKLNLILGCDYHPSPRAPRHPQEHSRLFIVKVKQFQVILCLLLDEKKKKNIFSWLQPINQKYLYYFQQTWLQLM